MLSWRSSYLLQSSALSANVWNGTKAYVFMFSFVPILCQVSADSVVKTAGGDVSIKRLVGTTIDVDTNGGDMYIGSLYGNGKHLLVLETYRSFTVF